MAEQKNGFGTFSGHSEKNGKTKATLFTMFLQDEEKMVIVVFLCDFTSHLNEPKAKLQGKDKPQDN